MGPGDPWPQAMLGETEKLVAGGAEVKAVVESETFVVFTLTG